MEVFVDSSGLLPLLDPRDEDHGAVSGALANLHDARDLLVSHNYVLLEACALAQQRFGMRAARELPERFAALAEIVWVDEDLHAAAVSAFLTVGKRNLSLVDCVSFEVMRRRRIETAFTIDRHFRHQGFKTLP